MTEPPRPIRPRNDSSDDEDGEAAARDAGSGDADSHDPGGSEPDGGSESSGSGSQGASPLPSVREVMGEVDDDTPEPEPLPSRTLLVDGARWEVTCIGATRSGEPGDAGAPLLLVRFERVGDEAGENPAPVREGWAVGRELSEVPEFDLVQLLERARPVRKQ